MNEEKFSPPVAGSRHVNASTATLIVPPRPDLPPGWTVPTVAATRKPAVPPAPPKPALPETSKAPRSTASAGRPWVSRILDPHVLLGVYLFLLTLIALWPTPVDSDARPFLRAVARIVPVLTYPRIEFAANILLFVPFGLLLALILRQRYLIVPIAFVASVTIESVQALMIDKRVPSVMDIIANLAGACIGLLIVAVAEWWRGRRSAPGR